MFNFFKKKITKLDSDNIETTNPIVSITYNINSNFETSVDITMEDYNEISINGMCSLLNVLSDDRFYIETINMIKQGLINDNQPEILLTILTHIGQQARNKILQDHKDSSIKDEPCIKPSDML